MSEETRDDTKAATDGQSFGEAMEELEQVLRGIEAEAVDVDVLASELQRAASLLEACRAKIRKAELEIGKVVHQLAEEPEDQE